MADSKHCWTTPLGAQPPDTPYELRHPAACPALPSRARPGRVPLPLLWRPALQVFTGITPAWNNENLNRLATKLESGVIFAHVRAAYPGMPVSEQNCERQSKGGAQLQTAVP